MKIDWNDAHRVDIIQDYEESINSFGYTSYVEYLEKRLIAQYELQRKFFLVLILALPLIFIASIICIVIVQT